MTSQERIDILQTNGNKYLVEAGFPYNPSDMLKFWRESSKKMQEMVATADCTIDVSDEQYLEYGKHMWKFRTKLYLEEVAAALDE
jgi:hypothetical protein